MKLPLTQKEKELYETKWTDSQRASLHKGFTDERSGYITVPKDERDVYYDYGKMISRRKERP